MIALLVAALLVGQDPIDERLRVLVEKLGAEDLEERERASKDLLALGLPALPGLEKRVLDLPQGEARARVNSILDRLRRLSRAAGVAPPVKLVTHSAKEAPLRSLLGEISRQSGVAVDCADDVADRTVTLDLKAQPFLQALDRVCLARSDLQVTLVDGKPKVTAGTTANLPSAYSDGFRMKLQKRTITVSGEFGKSRTDVVVHVAFDAQPDQKFRSVVPLPGAVATSPSGAPVAIRSTGEVALGGWISTGPKSIAYADEVLLMFEEGDAYDLAFFVKDAPSDLKSFGTLRVKARYRFQVGVLPATSVIAGMRRTTMLGELPYSVHLGGRNLYLYTSPKAGQPLPPVLSDLIDVESVVVVDAAGKENKLTLQPNRGRAMQYSYVAERDLKDEEMTLKYNLLDTVDREVEFELKDVKLRD